MTLELATAKYGVIGVATINDLTIRPGDNLFPMTGTVDQTKAAGSLTGTDGLLDLLITGNSSTYNGQRIPYYVSPVLSQMQ